MFERLKRLFLPATPAEVDIAAPTVSAPAAAEPVCSASLDTLVIDVRSEREFQATAIEHAVNVPLPQLAHRIGELVTDKATPLVLYCASGARSGSGCQLLQQLGYTNVTNAGGLYAAAERLQREVRR
jgi:phage shock protein E